MILAQLQLFAQITFASGQTAVLARFPYTADQSAPVAAVSFSRPGYPSIVISLNRAEAIGWAHDAWVLGTADTAYATWRKFLPIVKYTVTCSRVSCSGSLVDVELFKTSYAYLRPGPFPKGHLRTIARLLWLTAGFQPDSLVSIPWIWKEAT